MQNYWNIYLYTVGRNVKLIYCASQEFSNKFEIFILYDLAISFSSVYSRAEFHNFTLLAFQSRKFFVVGLFCVLYGVQSILGLYLQETSKIPQVMTTKSFHTLPNIAWGQNYPRLRTTLPRKFLYISIYTCSRMFIAAPCKQ